MFNKNIRDLAKILLLGITAMLMGFKLMGVADIPWWKVFLPVLLPVVFLLGVSLIAVLYILLDTFVLTPIKRKIRDHRIIRDQREQRKRKYKL